MKSASVKRVRTIGLGGAWILFWAFLQAASAATGVKVTDAWARATAPGQTTASVYFEVVSAVDAALVGATSPIAQRVEMHIARIEGGVMKMRPVKKITLPAGNAVKLAPAGMHLMLVGIKHPLKEYERIPLTIAIEGAGHEKQTIDIAAEVRPLSAPAHHHGH